MNTRALLRLSAYSDSQRQRQAPWRPLPGPEPYYDWDLGDITSMLRDMYCWMDYHCYYEDTLQSALRNGFWRYFAGVRYHQRKEIINQALREVNDARDAAHSTLYEASALLNRLVELETRGRLYRAGYTHQDYYVQKEFVKELRKLQECWRNLDAVLSAFNDCYIHLESYWQRYAEHPSAARRTAIERTESFLEVRYDERSVFGENRRYGINDGREPGTDPHEERGRSATRAPIARSSRSERTSTPLRDSVEGTSDANNEAPSSGFSTTSSISSNTSQTTSRGSTGEDRSSIERMRAPYFTVVRGSTGVNREGLPGQNVRPSDNHLYSQVLMRAPCSPTAPEQSTEGQTPRTAENFAFLEHPSGRGSTGLDREGDPHPTAGPGNNILPSLERVAPCSPTEAIAIAPWRVEAVVSVREIQLEP